MEINIVTEDITRIQADGIIVNLFEGVKQPDGATGAVDKALGGVIAELIDKGEIKGKLHEVTVIHTLGKLPSLRVAIAGLGKKDEFTVGKVREVVAEACRTLESEGARKVASIVHGAGAGGLDPKAVAQSIAEGAILGLYSFDKYKKKEPDEHKIEELTIVESTAGLLSTLQEGVRKGRIMAEATVMARDMVNEPANEMTPAHMAEKARQIAGAFGLSCTVMERDEVAKLGMGAFLGVAQGSSQPPKFIVMKYAGDNLSDKAIGFIGKGITFDSGGISIKGSDGMGEMKTDMAGGAAVICAMRAIAQLKPTVNVTAIVAATENMPDGSALRPGDILRAINGKTIEIISTDAEGRLTLADALGYGVKHGLSPLIDLATLTGACITALGHVCTGGFTNNPEFLAQVVKAGDEAGERIWELPMYEDYKEANKSDVADIKNSGNRTAGAITAAQFLGEFVDTTPWVHLDIAGTASSEKEHGHIAKGATGVGVRMLVNLALARARK